MYHFFRTWCNLFHTLIVHYVYRSLFQLLRIGIISVLLIISIA